MSNYEPIEKIYNADEFLTYIETETQKPGNENKRYELIDGVIYMMGSPNMTHYNLVDFIETIFKSYFGDKGCQVIHASVDLFLFDKKKFRLFNDRRKCNNVVIPDLMVVCDKAQVKNSGIYGAPEFVVEVISKSNPANDYVRKLNAYLAFGVKEYWIVNPIKKTVRAYDLTIVNDPAEYNYTFDDIVNSEQFKGLSVDFTKFNGFVED